VSAVRTWFSVVVPVTDTPPVGASLTLAIDGGRRAGRRLREALAVGVADDHADHAADVAVAQRVGRLVGGPDDVDEARTDIVLPLVVQRPQAIDVGQGRDGGQDLVSVAVPVIDAPPVCGSLTPAMAAVAELVTLLAKPWPSV
jgi:hypothetical protein